MVNILDKYWTDDLYLYDCESKQSYEDAKNMLKNYSLYLNINKASPLVLEKYFLVSQKFQKL